jgi:hypothetical protein
MCDEYGLLAEWRDQLRMWWRNRHKPYVSTRLSYRLAHMAREACYRLRCRFWHRYNVVVCHNLPSTWCDRDCLMLYAAFQILSDFIEREKPWEFTGDVYAAYVECDELEARGHEAVWKTIRELYAWWQRRKNDRAYSNDAEDNKILHTLIGVRAFLWT